MTKIRGALLSGLAAAAMGATAPSAGAVVDPGTFAVARDGQLIVVSSVILGKRTVEMMGGWNSDAAPCDRMRRLDVEILVDRVRRGNTTRFRDDVSARVQNCAEGGPNLGFQLTATDLGMACPDGTWRRGHYTFVTDTLHRRRGLRAVGDLFLAQREPC
jgi:hypothetical protein